MADEDEGRPASIMEFPPGLAAHQLAIITPRLDALLAGLREARAEFDAAVPGEPVKLRAAARHSLEAVLRFLLSIPVVDVEGLQTPLGHLREALLSLDDGAVLPILEKKKRRGRSAESGAAHDLWGLTAFFVDELAPLKTEEEARKALAKILARAGFVLARGNHETNESQRGITADTVAGWCKRARSTSRHTRCRETYEALRRRQADRNARRRAYEEQRRQDASLPRITPARRTWGDLLKKYETALAAAAYEKGGKPRI